MLEKELRYYGYNRKALLDRHLNKFLVIKGQKIIATYDTHAIALAESIKTMLVGTFLIQHCVAPDQQE
jgi:hypothetical protein